MQAVCCCWMKSLGAASTLQYIYTVTISIRSYFCAPNPVTVRYTYTLHVTRYTIHVTRYTIHVTRIHVTRYTIHNTQYTSHVYTYTISDLPPLFWNGVAHSQNGSRSQNGRFCPGIDRSQNLWSFSERSDSGTHVRFQNGPLQNGRPFSRRLGTLRMAGPFRKWSGHSRNGPAVFRIERSWMVHHSRNDS